MKTNSLIKKTRQLKISRKVLPFDQIGKVLLLLDSEQPKTDIEEIRTFGHELRKKGKDITFLTYHPLNKLPSDMQANELYKLCCKGDFNFFGLPKSKVLKDVLEQPFDLLINGCLTDNEYLKTISVFSKAKFRVGPFLKNEDTSFYELLIKPNGADPCENYLIETGRYLLKII